MLREKAHQYKKSHAATTAYSLSYNLFRGFIRYVIPSLTMILMAYVVFTSLNNTAVAEPQGFSSGSAQRAAPQGFGIQSTQPNTVNGVLANGQTDDYVVLEGRFLIPDNKNTSEYFFSDAAGNEIKVDISNSNNNTPPLPNANYFLWGQVERSFFATTINAIEYTPML